MSSEKEKYDPRAALAISRDLDNAKTATVARGPVPEPTHFVVHYTGRDPSWCDPIGRDSAYRIIGAGDEAQVLKLAKDFVELRGQSVTIVEAALKVHAKARVEKL